MDRTPSLNSISTKQRRIAELAQIKPKLALTTLAHHLDLDWMREAYRLTRKDGAVGVDGQTAEDFESNLEDNLTALLDAAKSGSYRAPPVRRAFIPKSGGDSRPIGIPTFADKVLQRAIVMLLQPIYEQDFLPCSFGFRPGLSAHHALDALWRETMQMHGGWVVELDIVGYFDHIEHGALREMLHQRIRDGVVLRLIGKWLNAGVLAEGVPAHPLGGVPQGGVISPLLSNVYLHEVLDCWFAQEVLPRLSGRGALFRYADDAVMVFAQEADARRVLEVLPKRFLRYGLTLHPEKTRLVRFQRPPRRQEPGSKEGPETFAFLGFTHYWGRTQRNNWAVKRKTAQDRFSRAVKAIRQWCRRARHLPVHEQRQTLGQKLRGHYGYFGIIGNYEALRRFYDEVRRAWHKWLSRRSDRARIPWTRWGEQDRYALPTPKLRQALS